MKQPATAKMLCFLTVLGFSGVLSGCSSQPAANSPEVQTKEQDAKEKMTNAYANDPTLQKPGAANAPTGGTVSPGPVPGSGR